MQKRKIAARLGCAIALALVAGGSAAQGRPSYGQEINLADAKSVAAGAIAEAKRNNWPVAIAIVDNHGFLVYFEKLDDTQSASVNVAIEKARTAAMFRRPSKAFETAVSKGRVAVLGLSGAMPITGGVPIVREGKVIGACGASGVASEQDEQACEAGVKALN